MERNLNYWGKPAKLDKVVFIPLKTNELLLKALMEGRIDLTDGIIPNNIPVIRSNPKLFFKAETGLNFAYLGMNTSKKPFNDIRVRQAVAHAINKKVLINKYFFNGQAGIAAKSCLPPNMFGYYKDLPEYAYDPPKAKALLAVAGYKDGFETTLMPTGAVRPYMPDPGGIAIEIKNQLAQIGIRASLTPASSWKEFLEIASNKPEYNMALIGWIADSGDPNDYLTFLLSTQSIGVHNTSRWSNKKFDDFLIQAQAQPSNIRQEYYQKAQMIVYEEVPLIPLFHSFQLAAWNERVQGFNVHPTNRLLLKYVAIK